MRKTIRRLLVGTVFAGALLGGAAQESQSAGPSCTLTPQLREVAIDQGLPGYPKLVRGKETLIRPFFTLPSCADTANGANIMVKSASIAVKNGTSLLTPSGGIATATAPLGPAFPLITTPSGATLPPDAAGNPIFVVPGSVLASGSTGGAFTATFEITLTYAGQANNAASYTTPDTTTIFTTPTGSRTAITKPVEAKTNALRILAVPMGGLLGADATTNLQNAMTTMSRIWPVPDGTGLTQATSTPRTGDLFHASGGIRYSLNAGPVNLTGLLDSTGQFCGNSTNWTAVKSQLAQFLQTWNSTNTSAQADRVSGVGDPFTTISNMTNSSCAEGMASVISPESWFRASADKGGPTLSMEMCHTFGCVPSTRSDGSYHSIYPNADFTTGDANRGYNVTDRTYLSDDKNAMRYAISWTNANAIFGRDDFAMMLCKLGGATTTDCTKSNVAGTSSGVAAGTTTVSFVMSGTTDGTKAGTEVLESFKAATLPTPSDSSSPYRLRQFAGAKQVADDGVPVSVEDSVHNEQGGHDESPGVFSIAFPLKSNTNKIQLINTAAPNPPLYEANANQAPAISAPSLTLLRSAQAPISSAPTISVSPSIEKMFAPVHARLPRRVLPRGAQAGAFAALTGLVWARRADAAIYTVNSNADPGDGTCGDGSCTLRDAIIASNASTGATDTIAFELPGGSLTITPESALPAITRPVVIDGTTQPGYVGSPIVELSGATVSGGATIVHGLVINASNTTVRGLVINRFSKPGDEGIDIGPTSSADLIQGNYIGTDVAGTSPLGNSYGIVVRGTNTTVGGTTAGTRNVVSGNAQAGVRIESGGTGNALQGNYIGTKANGTEALGNGGSGVEIVDGSFNTIGGLTAEARNVISGNGTNVQLVFGSAHDNVVQGNYIGTDANGTVALGGTGSGVEIFASADNNRIGGPNADGRNVISGNGGRGVLILDSGTTGNLVDNNYIGLDATGTAKLANGVYGVQIQGAGANTVRGNAITGNASGVVIGGSGVTTAGQVIDSNAMGTSASGATVLGQLGAGVAISNSSGNAITSNIIAGHTDIGILIDPFGGTATGNSIRFNSIKENAGIGIDLAPRGVTANDSGDADTGANDLQNFPVLSSVTRGATSTTVQGSLNSSPSATFQLDFFSNAACDSSGNGEGATLLGSQNVTTDSGGNASFTFTIPTTISATDSVTATATTANNTSEFSACRQAAAPASADLSITKTDSPDPVGLGNDLTYTLTVTNNGPNTANAVQVTDTLPASVHLVSVNPSQGTCSGSTTVTCVLGDLANGGTATVTIVVETGTAGSITNQATVSSTTADSNPDNNSASATTAVETAEAGQSISYTATDADTDSCLLKSDLLLKHLDGTFDVLAVGLTPTTCGSPATFNFTASVGCQGCEIDAKVYDGFASSPLTRIANSTETDTIPTDPVAAINSPESGASVRQYDPVTLNGSGWDAQDGVLPGGSLTWSSNCLFPGTNMPGTSLYLSPPTGGWEPTSSCTVSLYATDSNGNRSATVSRTFQILADADHDNIPASLDVKCAPNVGTADDNALNDRADDDQDGIPNGQDPDPCHPATTYNAIATFQPDPLDVTSTGNTVSMLVQVPYRDLKQVDSTTVAITVNELSTKLFNVSWIFNSNGIGNAQFNRQALLTLLANNNIHNRRILITISGNSVSSVRPWSFQGIASTYVKG